MSSSTIKVALNGPSSSKGAHHMSPSTLEKCLLFETVDEDLQITQSCNSSFLTPLISGGSHPLRRLSPANGLLPQGEILPQDELLPARDLSSGVGLLIRFMSFSV